MDLLTAYYHERFRNEFREATSNAFQAFFSKVMSLAYKDDFMSTRTWGNIGDQKNDGFLISDRRLFQVYAPYDMESKNATK